MIFYLLLIGTPPPFAANLAHAHAGMVLGNKYDFSDSILQLRKDLFDETVDSIFKKNIQKHIAAVIKPSIFPNNIFLCCS